jgi:dTDP-4-amino-4,6-dideoxygalactose transaminase
LDKDIEDIFKSGQFTSADFDGGKWVQRFEGALTEYLGKEAVLVNSGTSALITALHLAGVGPGDNVAVPGFTFKATWNAVKAVGATVCPVDVTEEDQTIDLNHLHEVVVSKDIRAIITVHLYGHYAKAKEIKILFPNIPLIEDACQSLGTSWQGQMTGTFGDYGCFSFYPSKIINTMEGGAVVCNKPDHVRSYRNHGYGNSGEGINLRMNEVSACMGYKQMQHIEEMIEHRRAMVRQWQSIFEQSNELYFSPEKEYERRNGQLFTILTTRQEHYNNILRTARVYYPYCLPGCPTAKSLIHRVLSFSTLSEEKRKELVS